MFRMGIILYLSLPNSTAVVAEMDDLYSTYKPNTRESTNRLFSNKLKTKLDVLRKRKETRQEAQAIRDFQEELGEFNNDGSNEKSKVSAVIYLEYNDIPFIVNGNPDDVIKDRPFSFTFTRERIRKSWRNVGFLPMTYKCLESNKVRHESGENTDEGMRIEALQRRYIYVEEECKLAGLNDVFVYDIPHQKKITRMESDDKQIEELVQSGGEFHPSGLYMKTSNICSGSHVFCEAGRGYLKIGSQIIG